jgi:hypothetical protein
MNQEGTVFHDEIGAATYQKPNGSQQML